MSKVIGVAAALLSTRPPKACSTARTILGACASPCSLRWQTALLLLGHVAILVAFCLTFVKLEKKRRS